MIRPAGDDLEVADLARSVLGPAVGLDEADDHVGAPAVAPPALVQHGEGLADAGRGPQVDAQRPPGHGRAPLARRVSWSRARLRSSTLTVFSPRTPHARGVDVAVDEGDHAADGQMPGPGDPGRLVEGVGLGDVGVEAGARGGHRVDGHRRRRRPVR